MSDKITFSEFQKLDLRVGKILEVKEHPNADKLFVLKVDLGEGTNRTIVAGLREYYNEKELIDKLAVFVMNLEPVVLRGIKSEGMVLAASDGEKKKVVVLSPDRDVEIGARVS